MTKGQTYLLSIGVGVAALAFLASRDTGLLAPTNPAPYRFSIKPSDDLSGPQMKHLESRLKENPNNFLEANELASLYFARGLNEGDVSYFEKAEALAKDSLKQNGMMNPAKLLLAEVAEARHDFKEAIRLAGEALRETPASAGALGTLATSHLATGNLREALRNAEEAVHRRPGSETLLTRALVLSASGRDEEALFDFKRAAALEDIGNLWSAARLRTLWGRLLVRRGELATAEALFDEALRILPGNHLALFYKGTLELRRGKPGRAEKLFLDAFQASHQTKYLVFFARAKAASGDAPGAKQARDDAEQTLRKSLRTEGFGHRLELAELLLDDPLLSEARAKEAVALAEAEVKIRQSAEALGVLARSQGAVGNWEAASKTILDALSSGVHDPLLFTFASRAQAALGFQARAELLVDRALAFDPAHPEALAQRQLLQNPKKKTVAAMPPRS